MVNLRVNLETERDAILGLGFHIGINGCSLKTDENLKVAAGIPADRYVEENIYSRFPISL